MGYIYLITNTVNGKQYVGQTLHLDIETRWKQHRTVRRHMLGRHIYSAYSKYGIDKFTFKIICICFDEACNALEEQYIQKFNTLAPNGYNLKAGGKNSKHNPETIQLISDKKRGIPSTTVYTPEMCKARSERQKGEKNHNFGKHLPAEQKEKISQRMKEIWIEKKKNGFVQHENVVKALVNGKRKYLQNKPKKEKIVTKGRKQRVARIDDDGNILEEFESIEEASKSTNLCNTKIAAVCRGERTHTSGTMWKYLDVDGKVKRNNSTGELYINKYSNGYMIRINKVTYKYSKWFKTLEEAIEQRDKCLSEMNA